MALRKATPPNGAVTGLPGELKPPLIERSRPPRRGESKAVPVVRNLFWPACVRLAPITIALLVCACSGSGSLPFSSYSMNPQKLVSLEKTYAHANSVPLGLVRAVVDAESKGNPYAISRAGAQGLMQLMPATQARYGVCDPYDPAANVDGGTRYLHDLLVRYHNDIQLALAAYNAGPAAVAYYHGIPPFAETRSYVARVSAELQSL
jgi:soluble lytic murein transglycosylase-like protein